MLDVAASCPCMQLDGKRMIQTEENDKFRPDIGPLESNSARQFFPKNLVVSVISWSAIIMRNITKNLMIQS